MELRIASVEIEQKQVKVEVWEAGQLNPPLLAPYYKAAKAVLVVFDPADPQALTHIRRSREMTHAGQGCVAVAHLKGDQPLELPLEVQTYCQANGIQLETANAQTDLNVGPLFLQVCQTCLRST